MSKTSKRNKFTLGYLIGLGIVNCVQSSPDNTIRQ